MPKNSASKFRSVHRYGKKRKRSTTKLNAEESTPNTSASSSKLGKFQSKWRKSDESAIIDIEMQHQENDDTAEAIDLTESNEGKESSIEKTPPQQPKAKEKTPPPQPDMNVIVNLNSLNQLLSPVQCPRCQYPVSLF